MKILHLNTYDMQGGAARAAYRLHKALLKSGLDSQLLVQFKKSNDSSVLTNCSYYKAIFYRRLNKLPLLLYPRRRVYFSLSLWGQDISDIINKIKPDIVHMHWISAGFVVLGDLLKVKAPIVWSLHDDWAYTGGCHIKWDCEKYLVECGKCPRLLSNIENDLSKFMFRKKNKIYSKLNLTIVGLSVWITECAKKSFLLHDKKIFNLPNLIDTKVYKLKNKADAKKRFNLPLDKKLILVGASGDVNDKNKGFGLALEAIKKIRGVEIVFLGNLNNFEIKLDTKIYRINYLNNEEDLIDLYNSCDVTLVPSRQETLSNTIMESLSCGTPVVAFKVGGNGDMIDHKKNGYLANPFDTEDLAKGIEWLLNSDNYDEISFKCRKKVVKKFDVDIVVPKYIELYKKILGNE